MSKSADQPIRHCPSARVGFTAEHPKTEGERERARERKRQRARESEREGE